MDDKLVEKAFLSELEALEKFRIGYTGLFPEVPLSREDPDVRRMIEALAFFSARTRVAAERTVNESLLRLFRQHFPYVLSPLPATVMLQATTTQRFVDPVELPRGVEVLVDRKTGGGQVFRFRTTSKLRVLPIELVGVELMSLRGKGHRILLRFESAFPRNEPVGNLSLYVNHLDDLSASMAVLFALKSNIKRASVIYDKTIREDTEGQLCEVSFGGVAPEPDSIEGFESPIERFRQFLHFPQRELFMHVNGIKAPRGWQQFAVCIDVKEDWPLELRLTPDTFALHVVPMQNLKRDMANPIECDGTRERYLVKHPDGPSRYAPHTIIGVYRMTDKGLVPLEPGVLGPTKAGYETVYESRDENRRAWLLLDLPGAFEKPERIAVDAYWHQPDLSQAHAEGLRARLSDRHVDGVNWGTTGMMARPTTSEVEDDRDALVALVSLKSQRFLGGDELTFLLRAMGSLRRPELSKLTTGLTQVTLETKPAGRRSGLCHVYALTFENLDNSDMPRLDLFCGQLLSLLSSWSIEQVVEIKARVPRLGRELTYAE